MTTEKALRPKPATGDRHPSDDPSLVRRAGRAAQVLETLWVPTQQQSQIIAELQSYVEIANGHRNSARRVALGGRRLSQFSQAGKSATAAQFAKELEQRRADEGKPFNPHRVVHVTIAPRTSLKSLYHDILANMADEFADEPNVLRENSRPRKMGIQARNRDTQTVLEQRIFEWVDLLGVEVIVCDEVQYLKTASHDATEVTKKLQALLDRGRVPIIFIGDETSEAFFKQNPQFAARLGQKLELRPLNGENSAERLEFVKFCHNYDEAIKREGLAPSSSCIVEPDVMKRLMAISGGHIGRVARLLQLAVPAAIRRGATSVDRFDLSNAVRRYAIDVGWIDHDPFEVGPDPIRPLAKQA